MRRFKQTTTLVLAIVMLVMAFAVPAEAADARVSTIVPSLSFSGTTATCSLRVTGESTSEHIEATIKLYLGNIPVATWTAEGDGYLFFSKTTGVNKGYTYTMKVQLTIDGEECYVSDVSGTCS